MFKAAQWNAHYEEWVSINASATVLSWIKDGVPLPFLQVPASFELPNRSLSSTQAAFVDSELAVLLQSGAVRHSAQKPFCISPIGCVPKKNKSLRLIVDLRKLNESCPCPAFQYEDINAVLNIVQPDDRLYTIDLKNGYHHLAVHPDFHKYLGFAWRGNYYVWQVIPFGLAVSPYFFCKTIRQVIKYVRATGIRISAYVDDFIQAGTVDSIGQEKDFVLRLFARLGFTINVDKSDLVPSTEQTHIGFVISTVNSDNQVWIRIPGARIHRLRHDLRRALHKGSLTARALARIAGQCVSMAKAIVPAKLLLRNLYRLLSTRVTWQDVLCLDKGCVSDLQWWISALQSWNGAAAPSRKIDLQVTSDASAVGWGGHCRDMDAQGHWTTRVAHQSSNYRELLALLLTQLTFLDSLKNNSVQFLCDNVTAVAYVNFQGGPSPELTALAQTIWAVALDNNMTITAKHLAGLQNARADGLSRLSPKYEWKLHPRLWAYLDTLWGPHTVDRFASLLTAQLPRYNSLYQDPLSEGVDALAQGNWGSENNFVNCPFRLLPRVLDTVVHQGAVATVIAPWWPSQHWFNRLLNLTVAPPVRLPKASSCLRRMGAVPEPLRNRHWHLYAFRISACRQ